jgi:hypothetical protein
MWTAKLPLALASLLLGACVVNTNPPEFADDPPRAGSSSSSSRDPLPGWEKLGEKVVNGKNDHDDIRIGSGQGAFRALRLRVTDSAMRMHDVVVEFTDGSKFSPSTRVVFDEDVTSNVIDLPGGRREIRRIGLRYSDVRGGGVAHLEVWGRR